MNETARQLNFKDKFRLEWDSKDPGKVKEKFSVQDIMRNLANQIGGNFQPNPIIEEIPDQKALVLSSLLEKWK